MAREPATMNAFEHARDLTGRGQFTDALHALAAATAHEQRSAPVETVRAELLERTGEYEAAQAIAAAWSPAGICRPATAASARFVLGRVRTR
jgi:thioredoxin-like negative regulator of GroEL